MTLSICEAADAQAEQYEQLYQRLRSQESDPPAVDEVRGLGEF